MSTLCVCGRQKKFTQCCGRFLVGGEAARTPVELMRSRYCAYAMGGYGAYLLKTWHPSFCDELNEAQLSVRSINWVELKVIDKSHKGDRAVVEFKAYFLDSEQKKQVHHERSNFEKVGGKWFYLSGEIM